jgi:hypothetical protein
LIFAVFQQLPRQQRDLPEEVLRLTQRTSNKKESSVTPWKQEQ